MVPVGGQRGVTSARIVLLGGLAVGVLDLLDAFVFFGLRGVPPLRILQSIASGLLGREAFQGGLATGLLGLGLHFGIATAVATVYYLASGRLRSLATRPWLYGPLYGLAVYAVMYSVVIPLSAVAARPRPPDVVWNGILIHIVGVGLPSALAARAARRHEEATR
ncbi:MAG TPA: hypothetical protein VFM17_05220 [Candidatus Eisenbacteria bacterium]|nr:hypothetical protein [Candidatus Eisenbacteria bacterium]